MRPGTGETASSRLHDQGQNRCTVAVDNVEITKKHHNNCRVIYLLSGNDTKVIGTHWPGPAKAPVHVNQYLFYLRPIIEFEFYPVNLGYM